jgi:hypothetical protein
LSPAAQRRWLWPGVFGACVLVAGAVSVALGKDVSWDLRNYHWYNAWALLNGRLGHDIAPAQLQTYHNPLADLPFYGLVQVLGEPRAVAFAMGLWAALGAFFLLRILVLLFPFDRDRANGALWIAASALIGLTGVAGLVAWGATFNEWPSIALAMAGLWLAVRASIEGEDRRPRAYAAAGFLFGCAIGLKLTFAAYGLGFLAACLAHGTARERLKRPLVAGAFMASGFLATYGWWGWILWREFANPFFPYFNATFQSPWWEPTDFFDRNFGPRNWRQWIFFPIFFARDHRLVAEVSFRDWRIAVLFALVVMCWLASRWRNLRENPNAAAPPEGREDAAWRGLVLFALVSYIAWTKLFGIYRYLAALEVVSGALIVGCVVYLAPHGRVRLAAVVVLAVLLVSTTRIGWGWGRAEFGQRYFDVQAPELPPDALVIVGYRHPLAYAIPFFRPDARFVSPANNFLDVSQRNRLAVRAAELIRTHKGPRFLLEYRERNGHDVRTLAHFGLESVDAACMPVKSSMDVDHMRLCPLTRKQ